MVTFLAFLFLFAVLGLVIGLIHPRALPGPLKHLRTRKRVGTFFGILIPVIFVIMGLFAPPSSSSGGVQSRASSKHAHKVSSANTAVSALTTAQVSETHPISFTTTTQDDGTIASGQTKVIQDGKDGVSTSVYTVTYNQGKEVGRTLVSQTTTTSPVEEIIAKGTYVAPATPSLSSSDLTTTTPTCTNGTYVNSAGNTVCSPEQSATVPAGSTARCVDGTYSQSQSRRGTCSHHGGVAQWY